MEPESWSQYDYFILRWKMRAWEVTCPKTNSDLATELGLASGGNMKEFGNVFKNVCGIESWIVR
jgi:hypothetical protein